MNKVLEQLKKDYGIIEGVIAPDDTTYDASPVFFEGEVKANDFQSVEGEVDGIRYRVRSFSPTNNFYAVYYQIIE